MANLNMNAVVHYNGSSDTLTCGNTAISWDYWRWYPDVITEYYTYPTYINTPVYEDKYKKAFNIAKLLLKKKLLVSRKLKDFIGLVEEIVKEL